MDDIELVLVASNILDIGEEALFRKAYTNWYGKIARASYIYDIYLNFIQTDNIPSWVRDYCRKTIEGEL